MKIVLTKGEVAMAKAVGRRREASAKRMRRKEAHGHVPDGGRDHILGALGECAVAKCLNRYWSQPDFRDRQSGDVGQGLHVRSTTRWDGRLIVHDTDPDDGVFILAIQDTYLEGAWGIMGWTYARDAKQFQWYLDETQVRWPAYFVPQNMLTPMEELRTLVAVPR